MKQGRVGELVLIATSNPDCFQQLDDPLIEVAGHGLLPVVQALVDSGMDPHQVRMKTMIFEDLPQTAVSVALSGGYLDVAEYLLEAGAKPEGYGWLQPKYAAPILAVVASRADVPAVLGRVNSLPVTLSSKE